MGFKKKLDVGSTQSFKFEKVGQTLTGHYVGTFDIVIDGRDVKKHVFSTEEGLQSVLGQTHLTQLLGGVEPGTLCRATLTGSKKTKPGRQPMKLFELECDDDAATMIDASAIVDTRAAEGASEDAAEPDAAEGEEGEYEEGGEEQEPEQEEPPQPVRKAAAPAAKPAAPKAPPQRPASGGVSDAARARANALLAPKK